MDPVACLSAAQLQSFASGELSDDNAAGFEDHVSGCATCKAALADLAQRVTLPTTNFGRYRLDAVLGSGGMGVVYRAWDPQLARAIAIKVVRRAGNDTQLRARLVREAQSLARLSHPHVCHVYDVGTEGDEVWVAMELIDGVTLREWAGDTRARAVLLAVLLDAADGLAAAHAAGLIHRDVKPENVLVTRDDRAVVMDFGLARLDEPIDPSGSTVGIGIGIDGDRAPPASGNLTMTGAVAGTPAYLAPEQLTGAALDARVDQFAWAAMAWELLTGMRPFPIVAHARLDAIRAGLTPPTGMAAPLAAALGRALAAAPRDRFATMREMIEAIREPAAYSDGAHVPRPAAAVGASAPSAPSTPSTTIGSRKRAGIAAIAVLGVGAASAAVWIAHDRDRAQSVPRDAAVAIAAPPSRSIDAAEQIALAPEPPPPSAALRADAGAPPRAPHPPPHSQQLVAADSPPAIAIAAPTAPAVASAPPGAQPFLRDRAISVISAFCRVPVDPAHPDAALHGPIADWGKITKREDVTADLGGRPTDMTLYELVGHRGTYHFDGDAWSETIGYFNAAVGDLVVLCPEDDSSVYTLPGAWAGPLKLTHVMLPISAPPRIATDLAALDPIHINDGAMLSAAASGTWKLPDDRRYLVRDHVVAADPAQPGRWTLGYQHYSIDVAATTRGAKLVAADKRLWFVLEHPTTETLAGKPHLAWRAIAIVDDIFPH